MGVVTMWVKVHLYSTDRSRVFMYISAEERAEYKKKLAEQPASCCSWLSKNHNKERQEALAAERAKRRPIVEVPKPTAPAESTTRTSGGRVSVSGVELGLIQPNSGVATDVGEMAMGQKRQPAHHLTKMLPLDHDSQSPFRGFGKAHSHPEAEPLSLHDDNEDEFPQFVLALLSDDGAWKADLPVTVSQVLGKESVLTAGQGSSAKTGGHLLRLGADDDNLSRQQLRVDTDATGDISVTRLGPNISYLQRAQGLSHSVPEPLPKGGSVVLRPGDILWLGKARYPLRLIERLPGLHAS
jgi:hypothetical protein